MRHSLIIISDMLGCRDWMNAYEEYLRDPFEIKIYDARKLAGITTSQLVREDIHQRFVGGGIETAAKNLLQAEKKTTDIILGFSVGGTIAWRSALLGLDVKYLLLVSATRLRYENQKPDCDMDLIYGELDTFKPSHTWFESKGLKEINIQEAPHDWYMQKSNAKKITTKIKEKYGMNET